MIEVPFEVEHFYAFTGREPQPEGFEEMVQLQYDKSFYVGKQQIAGNGEPHVRRSAFTIFDDDGIILCGGVLLCGKHGEVWMKVRENPPSFIYRHVKKFLDKVFVDAGLIRLATTIDSDKELSQKFISRLGFIPSARLIRYERDICRS